MERYEVREEISGAAAESIGGLPPLLACLLFHRGIKIAEEAEKFLNPDYEKHIHAPFLLKGMDKAVERIIQAIAKNERIAIWSDYDADGIPGAVVLHDFFKKIGYENFENYIPDRHYEGFGLNAEGIEEIVKRGAKLLITVDCGIADAKEIERAKQLGIDVIITDHHLPNGEFPRAFAVINPKQEGCDYPDKNLCGAGVVFKLVQALCSILRSDLEIENCLPAETLLARAGKLKIPASISPPPAGWEKWMLDMVGLATLSDMVPLTGENRVFAYFGLKVLRKSPRAGLRELLSRLKINQKYLTEDDIGFMVTPRINAASRMGKPMDAFKLLSTDNDSEAGVYADHLNKINDERKGHVAAIVKEARKIMGERVTSAEKKVIVIGNPLWRPSLLGLVANTLVEDHSRPVFLWGREGGDNLKGSCRSDGKVNLVSLMEEAKTVFAEFGGHHQSGGFTVLSEKIHALSDELERAYEKVLQNSKTVAKEPDWIDGKLSLEEVNEETFSLIDKLSPFGIGNPKPVFLFENVSVAGVRQFGKDKNHLSLIFKKSNRVSVSAISFFTSPDGFGKSLKAGDKINLVASLEKSFFRASPELRLRVVDILQ